jgi:protocatechuate 3,4-dioxygenase beta subunit
VLLPDAELKLPMRDVLIHELAHLARGDCYWNLLRRIGTALLFFQPLMWRLSRRLDSTAEEVCDDYVVEFGGDRREYAHRLVDIAELSVAPVAAAGVGIVSLRSMLAARVARIMDTSRSLSTRVGHVLLAIVLICGLLGTMLAGLVGVGPGNETAAADTTTPADEIATESTPAEKAALVTEHEGELQTVRGRVVDSEGNPIAGAHVRATQSRWVNAESQEFEHRQVNDTRSGEDGSFEISVPKIGYPDLAKNRLSNQDWQPAVISAVAAGCAPAWMGGNWQPAGEDPLDGEVTLQLRKMSPAIRGRLVNLEGQPLAGLHVQVKTLTAAESGKVDEWLATVERLRVDGKLPRAGGNNTYLFAMSMVGDMKDLMQDRQKAYFPQKWRLIRGNPALPAAVVRTDADGRFEIAGLPPDCLAELEISGPGVVTHSANVVTRKIARIDIPLGTGGPGYYGLEFDHPVAPGAEIAGNVTDAESGKPVAGVKISAMAIVNQSGWNEAKWVSTTDVDGRFRIEGLPADSEQRLRVVPPLDEPYIPIEGVQVASSGGEGRADIEIKLRRGVMVRGKVLDAETGKPVDATIHYHPFLSNEFARLYETYSSQFTSAEFNSTRYRTKDDGSFEAVVIPGRGVLSAQTIVRGDYCAGLGAEKLETDPAGRLLAYNYAMPNLYQRVLEIDVPADAKVVQHDLTVSQGVHVTLAVTDPQGEPLRGVQASGASPVGGLPSEESKQASIELKALRPGERRQVTLLNRQRRLGRMVEVVAPTTFDHRAEPRTVTLEPCATVTGRVVDGDGEPISGVILAAYALPMGAPAPEQTATDANGGFRFAHLPIGTAYRIIGHNSQEVRSFELVKELEFEAGETIDVDAIDITKKERPEPKRTKPLPSATTASRADDSAEVITIRGQVVDPNGNPAAGADVYVLRWYWDFGERKPLAQVKADARGRFEISYRKSQFFDAGRPDQWREAFITAFADGFGPGWMLYEDLAAGEAPTIRLAVDDVPIEGRIVDLEGNPVSGATIEMGYMNAPKSKDLSDWLAAVRAGQSISTAAKFIDGFPAFSARRWQGISTDADGRFRMTGIGRERQVKIHVKHPTIVTQTLSVMTRVTEPVSHPAYDFPGSHNEINYGARFEFAAAPSRPVEGIVRDAKSGEPIAGVEIWSSKFAGENTSGITTIRTKSDDQGRYRLEGMPKGSGNEIWVVPTDLPYFTAELDLPDPPGVEPALLDIELDRGVWVTGRVTDKVTGRPVSARMYYIATPDNPLVGKLQSFKDGTHIIYVQDRYHTAADGSYRVVALPGRGIIGVGAVRDAYPGGQGYDEIADLKDHDSYRKYNSALAPSQKYPTAVKEVDVPETGAGAVCDFVLDPGRRVTLRVVDSANKPLEGVLVDGIRETHGGRDQMRSAEVELLAFREGEKRTVLLHHQELRVGKALRVTAVEGANGPITVKLEPCATVTGRLVDGDGEPVRGVHLGILVSGDGGYSKTLPSMATDADGRFQHSGFLSGLAYNIIGEGAKIEFASVARDLEVKPGEIIDLGTIDVTAKERPEPKRSMMSTPRVAAAIAPASAAPPTVVSSPPTNDAIKVRGRVLDDGGQPIIGAKLQLWDDEATEIQATTSGTDGRFEIEFDRAKFTKPTWHAEAWRHARLLVTADGLAPEWIEGKDLATGNELAVQLKRNEVPIRGQVLTLEGQPVPNARLVIWDLHQPNSGSLDGMFESLRESPVSIQLQAYRNREMSWFRGRLMPLKVTRGTLNYTEDGAVVTADAEGRFEFTGIGPERLARGRIEGENIQSVEISIATRKNVDDWWMREALGDDARMRLNSGDRLPQIYSSTFEHLAHPSSLIGGVVLDRATGKPIPGIGVSGGIRGGGDHASGMTDENGRFELTGLAVDGMLRLFVGSTDAAQLPYIGVEREIELAAGSSPKPDDTQFQLTRGIVVRGTVTDVKTGAPVKARVDYIAHGSNPRVAEIGNRIYPYGGSLTNDKGEFAIVALPGRGALAATTNLAAGVSDHYRPVQAEDFGLPLTDEGWINTANHGIIMPIHYTAAVFLDLNPGEESRVVPLVVKPMFELARVQCVDGQGQPLKNVGVIGQFPWSGKSRVVPDSGKEVGPDSAKFIQIAGLEEEARQPAIFMHRGTNSSAILFGSKSARQPRLADLQKSENGLHQLTLKPVAIVTGKVVDDKGVVVERASVQLRLITDVSPMDPTVEVVRHYTNGIGRFTMEHVPAGGPYLLTISRSDAPGAIAKSDILLEPEQFLNLGTIDITKLEAQVSKQAANETAAPNAAAMKIHGRVIGPYGAPAASANVAVIGASTRQRRGGDLDYHEDVLATTTANTDGSYQMTLTGVSSKTHRYPTVIVRSEGTALAWRQLNLDDKDVEASFQLAADEPIRGRLVDIEGQPANNVQMSIRGVMPTTKNRWFEEGVGYRIFNGAPAAWPKRLITDTQGRFTVHGIAPNHGVLINVEGSDRFAPQEVALNTGIPEQRGKPDGTYRPLVKNLKPGEEPVLALAPAQIFEGVVRYEDTGQPAPHARLTIWARQDKHGSMHSVPGKADTQGRYRFSPSPGIRFGVTAYPPDGAPYLTRRPPEIDWDDAAKIKQVDVTLPRGVLVRGKVVESASGAPVVGATVQYEPEEANNPNYSDDILTGWQGIQLTNDRGEFEIVVMPGPGSLLVHGTPDEFVIRETSSLQLMQGRLGGARYYANAIERLDPAKGADPLDVTIELKRGAKITGQLVNEAGEPIDDALMITRLNIVPTTLSWRGDASKHVLGGQFVLSSLEPGVKYTVHFLDAKRQLGATVTLSTDDPTPTVVLKPCGQAITRYVDEEGEPIADIRPGLHMVVTQGVNELDFEARKRGELVADTDFLANIDRVNHWDRPPTDKDGRTTYPALIPGATYRILKSVKGETHIAREFTVESQQTLDLGEIVLRQQN